MPPKGRRGPSGPWGRLKPVVQDPLESMGLPSKGDNRLLEFSTQEKYYTKIMERYMGFCSDAGKPDELLRRFSALEIGESAGPSASPTSTIATSSSGAPPSPSLSLLQSPANTKGLSDVMMALRKLREGIVASKRVDDFAVQAYLFCIRLSVLVKHPESYHPAILYLLRALHPQQPLTSVELQEVVAYLVLDAACRRGQMSEAYSIRREYRLQDAKVDAVLDALAHDNYVRFRRLKQSVDGHRARIMDWTEREMRMQTLKALGRAYLSIDLGFLESVTGSKWDDLKSNDGVGWELEGDKVVIKKVRASTHTVLATKLASFCVSLTYGDSERMQCRLGSKLRNQRLVSRNRAEFLGGEKLLQLPELHGHSFYTCPEINSGLDDESRFLHFPSSSRHKTQEPFPFKQTPSFTPPNLHITEALSRPPRKTNAVISRQGINERPKKPSISSGSLFMPMGARVLLAAYLLAIEAQRPREAERLRGADLATPPALGPEMPPPKKRAKAVQSDGKPIPSALLCDSRAGWLVKSDEQTVEIIVKGEVLIAHRKVLIEHCEYFARCLKEPWVEGHNGTITFDDIEPRYLALFIGVAYSHSSIVPLAPPVSSPNPQAKRARTPLQDFVEVYKLCDRFVSPKMADYIVKCIHTSIGDGHRALYRCPSDEGQQKDLMREFADGFEALEIMHPVQKEIGKKMIHYFCEGVSYNFWDKAMEDVVSDRPRFISDVSRGFASRLGLMEATKRAMRRKELSGP